MTSKTYSEKKLEKGKIRNPDFGESAEEFADDYSKPADLPKKQPQQQNRSTSPKENVLQDKNSSTFIVPEI